MSKSLRFCVFLPVVLLAAVVALHLVVSHTAASPTAPLWTNGATAPPATTP